MNTRWKTISLSLYATYINYSNIEVLSPLIMLYYIPMNTRWKTISLSLYATYINYSNIEVLSPLIIIGPVYCY